MVTTAAVLLMIGAYIIYWTQHRSGGGVDGEMWLVFPFLFGVCCCFVGAILMLIGVIRYAF